MPQLDSRTVQNFPITKLWRRDGSDLPIHRLRDVLRDEADKLLSVGPVQIVVAQQGAPLLWMPTDQVPSFWKGTSKSAYYHTISSHEQQPDYSVSMSYLFYPSIWESLNNVPVVLLEGIFWPAAVRGAAPS